MPHGHRHRGRVRRDRRRAGDKVLYPRDAGYDVRLGGIDVKILKREEIIARDPRLKGLRIRIRALLEKWPSG